MPLASSNTVQLRYAPEATFGVIPATAPYNLRMTGESLNFDRTKENDKEINAGAELVSSTTVDASAGGDIKVHFQYAEYDRFLAGVLRGAWSVHGTNGVGATFTGTFTSTTITAAVAPTGNSAFTLLKKGQWFRLNAPTHANDGKMFRVSTTTAPTATVITLDASTVAAAGTSIANCSVATSRLTNGTTLQTFTIERETEVGQFFAYRGQGVSKFSTSFGAGSQTEATFTFMGKDAQRKASTYLTGTPVESQTYDIQNAVTGVGNIWEGGAPLTGTFIQTMTMELDSALRAQKAIGNLGAVGLGIGTFVAKGTLEVYFANGDLFAKFENDAYTSITVSSTDTAGNGYVFTFPKVQLTAAKISAGSKDTDLMASFEWTAYSDRTNTEPTLRKTMFIDRVGAAVT